jgi:hypothetical protein
MDYGSFINDSAMKYKLSSIDRIRVQNTGIRFATGAFHTSPLKSLHAESGESPPPMPH